MEKKLLEMETVFKALADSTRLRILGLLLTGEVCVCHIHDSLKISQPKASRHLAYLRRARLVETRRDGLWVHYRLAVLPDAVLETIHRTRHETLLYGSNDALSTHNERMARLEGEYLRRNPRRHHHHHHASSAATTSTSERP